MYFVRQGFNWFITAVMVWLLSSPPAWAIPQPLAAVDPQLEAQILQVIQDHPEAIIESVQAYQDGQQERQRQAQEAAIEALAADPEQWIGDSPTQGVDQSKNLLIEFSDFQCPFCARAAGEVHGLVEQHQDSLTFVYKHFPLTSIHDQALPAARAAWAAQQQGQFWAFHDALFAEQARLGEPLYEEIAETLNLDMEQFNRDRNSNAAMAAINQDIDAAQKIGVSGTPFFIFNGKIQALPLDLDAIAQQL